MSQSKQVPILIKFLFFHCFKNSDPASPSSYSSKIVHLTNIILKINENDQIFSIDYIDSLCIL